MQKQSLVHAKAVTATAALSLLLTACGGDDAGSANQAEGDNGGASSADFECGSGESVLSGENVRLVVGTDPGGGYDAYARMIAPLLGEELGAEVVVENQPGAGGLSAVNSMIAGEKDGTNLMIMNATGNISSVLAEVQGASFPVGDLTYIGRVAREPYVVTGAADGPYENWDDVIAAGDSPKIGSTGLGSEAYINGALINELFDLEGEVIAGYDSASEAELGLLTGDIQLFPGNIDSRIKQIESGDAVGLLAIEPEPIEALPDVAAVGDYDLSDDKQELFEAHLALSEIGRPLIGPPGMDEDATADLRGAMRCVFENPELEAAAEQQERPVSYLTGEETEELAKQSASPPDIYVEFLKDAYGL
ncbi:tripartite tricarboxylate transporter substrate-binding protein [Modestobacter sp. VKM Ac-2979]|uniref:tripartite tricarboxylate transporter substrate-binding protein n=1 Tax=unclassified Modestobacter TaxID=2643866 RepID=UPI0022AB6CA1|nr:MULTISPECIES: tripartite tricarboxylate transporter substrate-binding protein [unclassified Modestobacter]MCZ2813953.1 tripartite tricarboxylate transporter substrate-binding protein [Modestobacter sp. VKM Ac-2979]MCZ2844632.1 tripartite tricarboxylate transporter substrate-binding protein [Modestobacter sp. VKM Ac-2980]